tara:strand:+ start:1140 stop:1379 length:240 start_codon:yes stop_codon:yes gene_type:complete
MLTGTLVNGTGCFLFLKKIIFFDLILLLSLGVYSFFGQLFMTKVFQNTKAYMVSPFKYIEVIYTLLYEVFILLETYSFL